VSTILIVVVCRQINPDQIAQKISGQSLQWLLVALLVTGVQTFALALRWDVVLKGLGAPIAWRTVLSATYIGTFFNCWLAGTVGGDAARAILLSFGEHRRASIIHSVVFDRAAALAGLAVVVIPLVVLNLGPMAHSAPLLISLAVVTVPFVGLSLVEPLARWVPGRSGAIVGRLVDLARAGRGLVNSGRSSGQLLTVSALGQIILALIPYCLARAQHLDVSLIDFLLVMPPVVLLVALPISAGGWGVRESAMIAGLAPCGVAHDAAFLISVEMALLAALVSLPAGAMWLYRYVLRPLPRTAHAG